MLDIERERTPGFKLLLTIGAAFLLSIPLFSIYLLAYDRQSQMTEATQSITAGWGGPQTVTGPVLVIPYRETTTEAVVENGRTINKSSQVMRELTLAPEAIQQTTDIAPQVRKRSIYEAVVYDARMLGRARFALPTDLARSGVNLAQMDMSRAELRFRLSDPRGLGPNPKVSVNGELLRLQPGAGSSGGPGFFGWLDAGSLPGKSLDVDFVFRLRGNASLALAPLAGDTQWQVRSSWPSPSFGGDFLPSGRTVVGEGFSASYRIGNLALGRSLVSTASAATPSATPSADVVPSHDAAQTAQISLVQPVDLYSQVNRAVKYGFLFIGFTFLALLMFDVIGGVSISAVEYLLVGAALVLFFVLLLGFAEVIGFPPAYLLASSGIAGLNTAYSAAVLASWRRGGLIGGLLISLYSVLYILLSLEAFALLIGSLLLFTALAGVMFATRRIDWSAGKQAAPGT